MKRKHDTEDDGYKKQEPVKQQCQDCSSDEDLNRQQKPIQPQEPLSPLSESPANRTVSCEQTGNPPAAWKPSSEWERRILEWIPEEVDDLEEVVELEDMSQLPLKRLRIDSVDRGRRQSASDASSSEREAKSAAYKDPNYAFMLEQKGCFMKPSTAGPIAEDIELCKQLLSQPSDTPASTLFEDEYLQQFYFALQDRSEARRLIDLHPLLMPSAESRHIQTGEEGLKHVIDGYNDSWHKAIPIHGPRPQPDHVWGLKWSAFSVSQRQKLGLEPKLKSMYVVRDDMYFPYLAAEIKCGQQALDFANRQNMHSMSIALRAVVGLAQLAGCLERVNRRILRFSISHDSQQVQIHAYYPEIVGDKIEYYRWPLDSFNIWLKDQRWTSYRFVENVNRHFLPLHVNRLNALLDEIPDVQDIHSENDEEQEIGSQAFGSREPATFSRAASSQNLEFLAELRSMIQTLQQQHEATNKKLFAQIEELKTENKTLAAERNAREAAHQAREAEHQAREEKLLERICTLVQRIDESK